MVTRLARRAEVGDAARVEASSATTPPVTALESRRRRWDRVGDWALRGVTAAAAFGSFGLIALLIYKVIDGARPSISKFGLPFLWHRTWDVVNNNFGALDFIFATLYTTTFAVLFAAPVSIAIGLYLSELAPRSVRGVVGTLVEMLAAIPSVVLGLWGILVLGPVVHNQFGPWLNSAFGWLPFFASRPISGSTMFTAVIVLTIMIVPITASISRDLFTQVPQDIKEGAIGLGLTRWEMVRGVVLPYTRGGLIAAVLLGGGRAVGEAIAVTQVIGTTAHLTANLFQTGDTLASRIAAQYQGAASSLQVASLFYLGVILLFMSLLTNFAAQLIVRRYAIERRD
jgi:phosphate transport system permease protein